MSLKTKFEAHLRKVCFGSKAVEGLFSTAGQRRSSGVESHLFEDRIVVTVLIQSPDLDLICLFIQGHLTPPLHPPLRDIQLQFDHQLLDDIITFSIDAHSSFNIQGSLLEVDDH
jgi:hypothetical protein